MIMVLVLKCKQYPFESLFRSLQYALLDNSCREYLFISDFFMVSAGSALDLFNSIFGKSIAMFMVCILLGLTVMLDILNWLVVVLDNLYQPTSMLDILHDRSDIMYFTRACNNVS